MGQASDGSHGNSRSLRTLWASFRGWPRWAQSTTWGFVALIGLYVIGATSGSSRRNTSAPTTTSTTTTHPANTSTTIVAPSTTTSIAPLATTAPPSTTTPPTTQATPTSAYPPVTAQSATQPPATSPSASLTVHPGSYCDPPGATGVTSAGTPMVCSIASDGRYRWRSA